MRTPASAGVLAAVLTLLTGCSAGTTPTAPTPGPAATASPGPASPAPSPTPTAAALPVPTVEVTATADVVSGLDAPWGVAFLPDGAALVTLRDRAEVVLLRGGEATVVGGPGAAELASGTRARGEGGLLGVAVAPTPDADVYLYRTAAEGNEVLRGTLDGTALGDLQVVLDGIPAAGNHNGGRIAFGPDGYLYVATGDAGDPASAQDPASLGGKILRVTADGAPAPGNPDPASPVWSSGHRNVQGLGWTADGAMLASEFGQNTWDELNVIRPGGNYGWPDVEGAGGDGAGDHVDPVATWPTSEASPSGLAVTAEGVYLAGLRGARLWRVPLAGSGRAVVEGDPQALLAGELGRLRAVTVAPDGALWVVTNNTDGRGDPRPGDDRIVRVAVG